MTQSINYKSYLILFDIKLNLTPLQRTKSDIAIVPDPNIDMRHIQYQGEMLPVPPFPLVLAFHLVLGKFHI